MSFQPLQPGDRIFHPMYGFGVVEGVTTLDRDGQTTEFYSVSMSHRGRLTVPVNRAEALGLRVIVNGLAAIAACLRSAACPLSDNDRERVQELRARWDAPQSGALTEGVRDLMVRGRSRRLTPGDKRWLTSACERLSAEVALVDTIELNQARAAVQREIDLLKSSAI